MSAPQSFHRRPALQAAAFCVVWGLATQPASADLTEADFFTEVPVVLTTTRLAQSLFETPGAVTVIDRQTIQSSGARTLTDLLRLVPGYFVSGLNGANQVGVYHANVDEFGTRNLVLVDGRSVYSTTLLGGTIRGMTNVLLEDVERIEVLRGSNSAAYGANALFGVINVITRHPQDVMGSSVTVRQGAEGVADVHARVGWQTERGHHRVSLGSRGDDGYRFVNDSNRLNTLQWRSNLRLNAQEEVFLSGSFTQAQYGDGQGPPSVRPTDPNRTINWESFHLHGRWKQRLSETEERSLSLSWDESRDRDVFLVNVRRVALPVVVDYSFRDRRLHAEYEHQFQPIDPLRLVWGANVKQDSVVSPALFFTNQRVSKTDASLFFNAEWRMHPRWLLNAGLFAGHNSQTGGYASPRLMFNYQLAPLQTVRFGWSTAQRAPTLFERSGNVQYFTTGGQFVDSGYRPNPNLRPENLTTYEISYLMYAPPQGIELDVRLYHERFEDNIQRIRVRSGSELREYLNRSGFETEGIEYQLKWSPTDRTSITWNHNVSRFRQVVTSPTRYPPSQFGSIGLTQSLSHQWRGSVWVHYRDKMFWRDTLEPDTRVDIHLYRDFRIGEARATGALTVQSLDGSRTEFSANPNRPSVFPRRAFATLHVDF